MYFTNNAIAPYKRKRRIDSVRRHNDGLKEIGVKIKQKAHELASYFKQLPNSKKIVLVISQIAKIVGAILLHSARGEIGVGAQQELLKIQLQDRIDKLKALAENRQKMFGAESVNMESINARIGEKQKEIENANKVQQQSDTRFKLKLFIGLATGFAALVGDIFSISGNKQSELQRRDSAIKRMIDRKVRKALIDAGVKGMKRGQHVKARDPEYVESLRGGGGMSTGKKIAIGAGALAAGLGGVLLARKGKLGLFKRSLSRLKGKENPSDVFEAIGPQTQKTVVPPTASVSKQLTKTQKAVNKINSQFGESFDNFMRNRNNKMAFE